MTTPEMTFYTNIKVPSMTENGYDVINSAELDARGYLTHNQQITLTGDVTGIGETSIAVSISDNGVTPGTYNSVTVDSKGRVTNGSINTVQYNLVTKNINYTATSSENIILANGAITITLPSANSIPSGYTYDIKRISTAGPVVINVTNNGTIDNYSSIIIDQQYTSITIVSDGTKWWLI
jgi:hypothetical protein